jgi:hypothetical protein
VDGRALFRQTAEYAARFVGTLETRPGRPAVGAEELEHTFGGALPEEGIDAPSERIRGRPTAISR